jgi:hypothetical protein
MMFEFLSYIQDKTNPVLSKILEELGIESLKRTRLAQPINKDGSPRELTEEELASFANSDRRLGKVYRRVGKIGGVAIVRTGSIDRTKPDFPFIEDGGQFNVNLGRTEDIEKLDLTEEDYVYLKVTKKGAVVPVVMDDEISKTHVYEALADYANFDGIANLDAVLFDKKDAALLNRKAKYQESDLKDAHIEKERAEAEAARAHAKDKNVSTDIKSLQVQMLKQMSETGDAHKIFNMLTALKSA